jgi:hypothetical protein
MPPSAEPATDLAVNQLPAGDIAVRDSAAPIFGIALGMVVMIVLALNALAY